MNLNFCMLTLTDGTGEVAINPESVSAVKRLAGNESQVFYNGGHVTVAGVVEEVVLKLLRVDHTDVGGQSFGRRLS